MGFNITKNSYCVRLPPLMGSRGMAVPGYVEDGVIKYALPQFFFQFIVIFILNKLLTYMLRPIGLTRFVSQFLAGILLGPSCIGRNTNIKRFLFPKFYDKKSHSEEILDAETVFAYTFFIFIVAVKMDMGLLFRVGKKCWVMGVSNTLLPLSVGAVALGFLDPKFKSVSNDDSRQIILVGIEQSLTYFPVISWLLQDMKLLNTELGRLALSSAVISNIFSIVFLVSLSSFFNNVGINNVAMMVSFIIVVIFVIRPAMLWVARHTHDGQPVRSLYLNILLILVFLSGVASTRFGQFVYFGPFILGLAVPEGPPLGSAIVGKIENFFQGILLPIYVTSTVAKVNLDALVEAPGDITIHVMVILLVFAVKMLACLAPPLCCKVPFKDSLVLALILNCKGLVELGTYKFLNDTDRLSDNRLAIVVLGIFLSATLTPLLLRKLFTSSRKYGGYQRRNIMNLGPDAELPLLSCIHRADNITASVNLIDMLYPTKETPIKVHVLHLIKLIGQSTPELISHQKQSIGEGKSKSDSVILAFTNYMCTRTGSVFLNMFTVMSPPKMLPDYVCHLALDKLVSLVVLPFHKRWSKEGLVEHEDTNIQALNNIVLETAPCSVAILINRGDLCQPTFHHRRSQSSALLHVGMFFLGGNDDREAVVLAKRMARDPNTQLTIVHLCVKEELEGIVSWEKMMDDEVLNGIKPGKSSVENNNNNTNVRYVREFVEDGPQTALLVRSMAEQFNLTIVGQNHGEESTQTSGLREWTELPELGVLGDILASTDFTTRTSVLVIQQQKLNRK